MVKKNIFVYYFELKSNSNTCKVIEERLSELATKLGSDCEATREQQYQ